MHWALAEELVRTREQEVRGVALGRRFGRPEPVKTHAGDQIVIRRSGPGDGQALTTLASLDEHAEVEDNVQGHEELYVVTRGYATFVVGGDELEAPAGTVVFVKDPTLTRRAVARVRGTTVVAVGQKPGSFDTS